jgi:hypothetical protein
MLGGVLVSGACWLPSTRLDDLSGGLVDAAPSTPDVVDDPLAENDDDGGDAGDETGPPDAIGDDGPPLDAAGAGDADAGTWCDMQSPRPLYCSDFDEGSLVGTAWLRAFVDQGTADLDPTTYFSGPASFRASVVANTNQAVRALLLQILPASSRIHLGFEVRLGDCIATGGGTFSVAALVDAAYLAGLAIEPPSKFVFVEQFTPPDGGPIDDRVYPLAKTPVPGRWSRVDLDFTYRGGPVSLTVDGTSVLSIVSEPLDMPPGTTNVNLGIFTNPPASSCIISFDNVTIDPVP